MSNSKSLLARLANKTNDDKQAQSWEQVAATPPAHPEPPPPPFAELIGSDEADAALDRICARISNLVGDKRPQRSPLNPPGSHIEAPPPPVVPTRPAGAANSGAERPSARPAPVDRSECVDAFVPVEPESWQQARLTESEIESLLLKLLLNRGTTTGREMAEHVKLPFKMIDELLRNMKVDQLVVYRNAAAMNDYQYSITDMGRERGRRLFEQCTYFGSAPVSLQDYIASVKAQTIADQHPSVEDLQRAFADLLINNRMLNRLGPAINSGRGLFLYGSAGNGKTSIAERMTRAFGETVWIPRCLGIDGEIIRLFDPMLHESMPLPEPNNLLDHRKIDKRWVRIRRPTIVVGGELTMDRLEISFNASTGLSEAPLQMKSNCGTLVIDDFGRQKMRTDELLNRWIVPLEKRYDFLNLVSGKKIEVPFDQLIIFSTNLEPKNLVDDAFLRRIPYKIDVPDPSEEEFRSLFRLMAEKLQFAPNDAALEYLVEHHYKRVNRPYRCCQPRDLLMQVLSYCHYRGLQPAITEEYLDFAVENYFAVM